jgi:pimeloyl-ACP methyl ester carboxylesterase
LIKNMIEKYIDLNGIKTRYIHHGEGQAVLLIHGFGGFLESWKHNITDLSKNYSVYAVDLPGHGLSSALLDNYTLKKGVSFVVDFIEAMRINPVSLIGHSAGGLICASIAADYPEMVEKLVLVDTAGINKNIPSAFRIATIPVLRQIVFKLSSRTFIKYGTRRVFFDPQIIDQDWVDLSYKYFQMPKLKHTLLDILRFNAGINGLKSEVILTSKLKLIQSPTLIIHGDHDHIIPLDHIPEACRFIPRVRCEIFDRCGHCPQIENVVRFNWLVLSFLGENRNKISEPQGCLSG